MNSVSIGYFRDDGAFAILATLNNKDESIDKNEFAVVIGLVSKIVAHFAPDFHIEVLEREDAPDCVEIDD